MAQYALVSEVPEESAAELSAYSPLLQRLLFSRGIKTAEDAARFLDPSYESHLHDPFLLHDMHKAVDRVLRALEKKERIAIYSDYDCDGIPGGVILHDFFKAIGYENFTNYIPHRHYEGFGFNADAAKKLADDGITLIITIDCGTSDVEAVAAACERAVDVIITDHHEPKETLPDACAIINPKVGDSYPFGGLCGSGVVYKLVLALIAKGRENGLITLVPGWEKWWLDMVGLATIADMVPLIDENRALAHYGLQVLRKSRRPGLQLLLEQQRTQMRFLTEDDIGFTIAPRINAASRMDNPEDAFRMLSATDATEAGAYVLHLEKLNNERKGVVAAMSKEVKKRLGAVETIPEVIVLGSPEWRPSLAGLLANKLAEEYRRPAFVWGRDGNGFIKGSCRSDGVTSVVMLMEGAATHFIEYGGHHFSGGFSVHDAHIHTLPEMLNDTYARIAREARIDDVVFVDSALSLEEIDAAFVGDQRKLAPFGMGNPKPLYAFEGAVPEEVSVFGKSKEHTKLTFNTGGLAREAIAFFRLPEEFPKTPVAGKPCTIYAHVEESFFMGRKQVRLRIVDIM